ncbi:MAG: LytTR family DNA-binding domain-containing protein [Bacteroidales bacterium]|nr:LytTR family DNA-binding domain-containing protein [Bacteroidales bacterium]
MTRLFRTFASRMNKGRKETLTTRIISTTFMVVALAVFKPFGLDAWQWQAYVHLMVLGVMGILICMLTDAILKYVIKKPRSYDKGVSYIIRRNLWFQFVNTPLVSLGICLYRHFVLSDRVGGNQLSIVNFLETLIIIAFCSFAIGLYWRFKFRNKYLAMELEETRLLNEELRKIQEPEHSLPIEVKTPNEKHRPQELTLTGTTNESVTLQVSHLLYIEAVGNYMKVNYLHNEQVRTDMLRATMKLMEEMLQDYPMIVRCHRAFLVNLSQVEQIVSRSGSTQLLIKHCHESIPVSRSNMAQVKAAITSSR